MKRVAAALLSLAVLAGLAAVAGYPVFVEPQVDKPRPADAILVVGGDAPQTRYREGLALARQGFAPHLLLSNPAGQVDEYCGSDGPGFSVECFAPDPGTTQGEARELGRLARERGWQTVIVVTYKPHVSRARYVMSQCFSGELVMVGVPTRLSVPYWAWMYVYQGAGFVKAFVQRGC